MERAAADNRQDVKSKADEIQMVSFSLGREEFGVDVLGVQEIIRMVDITNVPQAPSFLEGVINLRGKVIPIVDLRKRFDLEPKEYDKKTRIVVVDIDSSPTGLIVEAVSEVIRLDKSLIEPAPELVGGINSEYITGVAKLENKLLILLDLSRIIDSRELASISS